MSLMRKAVIFCAGLLAGVALILVSQNMLAAGSIAENFSDFLQRLEKWDAKGGIKEVTFTGGEEIAYLTNGGERFVTTAPKAPFAYPGAYKRDREKRDCRTGIQFRLKQRPLVQDQPHRPERSPIY